VRPGAVAPRAAFGHHGASGTRRNWLPRWCNTTASGQGSGTWPGSVADSVPDSDHPRRRLPRGHQSFRHRRHRWPALAAGGQHYRLHHRRYCRRHVVSVGSGDWRDVRGGGAGVGGGDAGGEGCRKSPANPCSSACCCSRPAASTWAPPSSSGASASVDGTAACCA